MVHERNEQYDPNEESEYHFSDDQINYEVENDDVRIAPSSPVSPAARLAKYRRPIIGLLVFMGLIFVIYKIVAPSSKQPVGQVVEKTTKVTTVKTTTVEAKTNAEPVTTVVAEPPATEQPSGGVPITMPESNVVQPAIAEKTPSLEEKTAVQVNQMQAEFSQKLADADAQNNILQGKLDDLSMRMASMESNINRLSQLVEELKAPRPAPIAAPQPMQLPEQAQLPRAAEPLPRIPYTVQAIIPGRAWLKSDSGETITVAEGDIVKNLGRVIKIDPYDGVVNIQIGDKMVSLSYGVTAE